MWAFGTSPYGLRLTAEKLWGLSLREHDALMRVRNKSIEQSQLMLAAIRADLHNTSARNFSHVFEPAEFMASHVAGIETRAKQLIEQGYTPSEAAALASSRQSSQQKIHLVDRAVSEAHAQKAKGTGRRAR